MQGYTLSKMKHLYEKENENLQLFYINSCLWRKMKIIYAISGRTSTNPSQSSLENHLTAVPKYKSALKQKMWSNRY